MNMVANGAVEHNSYTYYLFFYLLFFLNFRNIKSRNMPREFGKEGLVLLLCQWKLVVPEMLIIDL